MNFAFESEVTSQLNTLESQPLLQFCQQFAYHHVTFMHYASVCYVVTSCITMDADGRLFSAIFADPVGDGGQWDMIVNLVEK